MRKGFTLLETGIVIGLMLLLATLLYISARSRLENAQIERAQEELGLLSRLGAMELKRGLSKDSMGRWIYKAAPGLAGTVIEASSPLCYNLAQVQGKNMAECQSLTFSRGTPPWNSTWNVRYQTALPTALPANATLLSSLGTGQYAANQGYNPWCMPYVLCFFPYRVEVLTCVPQTFDETLSSSSLSCGDCTQPIPGTKLPSRCVVKARALTKSLSISAQEPTVTLPNLYESAPKAVF